MTMDKGEGAGTSHPPAVVMIRVEIDYEKAQHLGIEYLADDLLEHAQGCNYTYRYEVVEATGPEGHACGICGAAAHPGQTCDCGVPPDGVPESNGAEYPFPCLLVEGCRG